ncbi:MAG: SMP-30/gluconolactonase/LRE family protein, partial [Pseudomonadota bacterium]
PVSTSIPTEIFDATRCILGEGPLWHPERAQFLWFDINAHQLLIRDGAKTRVVQFGEHVSAAGWVDDASILIASETRLFLFDLDRERSEDVEGLEPDTQTTRSNDGRADPWGGFWIGTMAKDHAPNGGAIYRYFRGEVRMLYPGISIPNAMCFAPDRSCAYYADTMTKQIMRQSLEPDKGWPDGEPEIFVDLAKQGWHPDGAVVDAGGTVWCAMFGAGRVVAFAPDGTIEQEIVCAAPQTTCPAFGGLGLSTLYCTSAARDMPRDDGVPHGAVFAAPEAGRGQAEHRVKL